MRLGWGDVGSYGVTLGVMGGGGGGVGVGETRSNGSGLVSWERLSDIG